MISYYLNYFMSKGQISYARTGKRKLRDDKDPPLQHKTEADEKIYQEVMEDMSGDFLKYINELIKPSTTKTPIKTKPIDIIQPQVSIQSNRNSRRESIELPPNKPTRIPTQQSKTIGIMDKLAQRKIDRHSFFSGERKLSKGTDDFLQLKKTRNLQDLLNKNRQKTQKPSSNFQSHDNKSFLQGIDEYVHTLQRQLPSEDWKSKIFEIQGLRSENKFLKNKITTYEQRFSQIQEAIPEMLEYHRNREKNMKKQIHQLKKALIQAVDKINTQKEEIDYLRDFLSNFSNQVQIYKNGRTNKNKLDKLLGHGYDERKIEETIMRTLRSEDASQNESANSDENSQIHQFMKKSLGRDMTPPFMASRSKTSSNIVQKSNISKSHSKDSKQLAPKNRNFLKTKFKEHSDSEYQ